VGAGCPCYLVGDAGSNHDASLKRALRLVRVAAGAEVDAVCFSVAEARHVWPRSAGSASALGDSRPVYEVAEGGELKAGWLPQLVDAAHEAGLGFLVTPGHEAGVERVERHADAFLVSSFDVTHVPLLRAVARTGKPVLLGTGASSVAEVARAAGELRAAGCEDFVLLQHTAKVCPALADLNLRALVSLREGLDVPTGLADASPDKVLAPVLAVALGAVVVVKGLTLSRDLPGPGDHFAVEPDELALLVRYVRSAEQALGDGRKTVLPSEVRHFGRRSVFSTCAVARGERFSRDNVAVLRHGELPAGLPPERLEEVLEARAARDLPADTSLAEDDLKRRTW